MFEKMKAWTTKKIKTVKTWVKENPGEAVCLVGGTLMGVVTGGYVGSAVGKKKGRIEGTKIGWKAAKDDSWVHHCELFGWDPSASDGYSCTNSKPLHCEAGKYIEKLQELDPSEKISGMIVIDSSVEPISEHDPNLPLFEA